MIVHICERMMRDVDAISRRFGHLVALHMCTTALLSAEDRSRRPTTCSSNLSDRSKAVDCVPENNLIHLSIPALTPPPLMPTQIPS